MLCLNFFQQVDLMYKSCKVWINKYSSNSSTGCVLEVDLYYKKLHDLRNDYPLAPVKLEIDKKVWLPIENANEYNIPTDNVKIF